MKLALCRPFSNLTSSLSAAPSSSSLLDALSLVPRARCFPPPSGQTDVVAADAIAVYWRILFYICLVVFLPINSFKATRLSFCVASDKLVASLPSPVFLDNTQAHTFPVLPASFTAPVIKPYTRGRPSAAASPAPGVVARRARFTCAIPALAPCAADTRRQLLHCVKQPRTRLRSALRDGERQREYFITEKNGGKQRSRLRSGPPRASRPTFLGRGSGSSRRFALERMCVCNG